MRVLARSGSHVSSSERQREIELAIRLEDHESMKRLIGDSVGEILAAGLTQTEMATLAILKDEHGDVLRQLISEAFGRGWVRSGTPNLSHAMHEVLVAAQHAVRGFQNPH